MLKNILKSKVIFISFTKLLIVVLAFTVSLLTIVILPSDILAYENFHGKSSIPKLNYDSLFQIAIDLETSPLGRTILDSCLSAYGGIDKLKDLKSVQYKWLMQSMMSRDTLIVIKSVTEGRKYSIQKTLPNGRYEKRIMDGENAWFQSSDTLIELSNSRYKSELFSYLVLQMPYAAVTEKFSEIKYGKRDNDSLHYFYFNKPDSLLMVIGISPDNFYIKTAEGIILQDGQNFVFLNKFSDHKRIDGYLFPHTMTNISMWLTVGQSVLKKAQINITFEKNHFYPDEKIYLKKAH